MRILEAGHYYAAHGPTAWSVAGWKVLERLRQEGDRTLLFIDDVHSAGDISPVERALPVEPFTPPTDYTVLESAVVPDACRVLDALTTLPPKKRARENGGRWYCSGFPLTNGAGAPLCVLLDAGLTLHKRELGFPAGVNILPAYYEGEQRQLIRLVAKAVSDFRIEVILFDLDGNHWPLEVGA